MMGFAQRIAWALLSLHQCTNVGLSLSSCCTELSSLAHPYFTGVFSLKKAHCPASTAEYRHWFAISYQYWQVINHVGWMGIQGNRQEIKCFSHFPSPPGCVSQASVIVIPPCMCIIPVEVQAPSAILQIKITAQKEGESKVIHLV